MKDRFPRAYKNAIAFLEKDFKPSVQVVLVGILLRAADNGNKISEVLSVFEREFSEHWRYQHPEIRGDFFVEFNKGSFKKIFESLDLTMPSCILSGKIPDGKIAVTTLNSTYILGPANSDGTRDITREGKRLSFKHGRLLFLRLGQRMKFENIKERGRGLDTAPVLFIEEAL